MTIAKLESLNVACVTSPAGIRSFVPAPAFTAAARAYEATNALDKTIEIDHGEILQELSQVEPAVTGLFLEEEKETPDELRKKLAELTAEMEALKATISDARTGVAAVAADNPASLKKAMELASQAVETAVQAAVDKFSKIFDAVNAISDRIAKAVACDLPSLAARAGAKTLEAASRPFSRAAQGLSGRAEKMRGRARGLESSKADEMLVKAQEDAESKREKVEMVKAGQTTTQTRTRSTV